MIFRLCPILFVVLMIPLSVFAESDDTEEDKRPKTPKSLWQRILPRTGDIEGTVFQPDTDTPLFEAEVRIIETDQHQKTGKDGTFRFTEIPVGQYTLSISHTTHIIEIPVGKYTFSISHSTHRTPTEIPIEILAGKVLRGRFYPGAEVSFINTTDSGDIDGAVYDQTTGQPLAEAEVRFVEINVSGKTDASGNFQFVGIAVGTHTLSITHPTYKTPTTLKVEITAGDTAQVKIYLGAAVRLETIVVEGQRLPPTVSRKEIRGSELIRIPGAGRDAIKGLTTLPSIGIPNDLFGILYIRGSAPGETLLYLDRTPLGYPFHYGGLFSTINSDSLEDIRIYAGGYGAEFGLDSQSVIDIRSREHSEKQWSGATDLNIISPAGFVEAKIGDKGYASAAGRFTTHNLILGLFFDWTFPTWSDYQLKFAYEISEKHHLTLNGLGATDHFDFSEAVAEGTDSAFYFKNGFEAEGIHLRSIFTDKLSSHLSLTRSHNFLNIHLGGTSRQDDQPENEGVLEGFLYDIKVNTPMYTLREDVSYKLTPTLQLEPGFLLALSPAKSHTHTTSPGKIDFESEEAPTWTQKLDEFNYTFRRAEGYLQTRYDPLSFLSIALGVRLDYLNLTEELSVQPRGSLSFTLPTTSKLRFAYGRYEQSPLAYQVLKAEGNRNLKPSLTEHYIMELEHELSPQTELKFALYYKDMQRLVTRSVNLDALFEDSNAATTTAYLNQGAGFVSGAEIFLRHRVSEKFFGWLSYAYTHLERRETPDDVYKPFLFDNTHIVSIVANYNPTTKTEIGAKWQYSSGTTAVPLNALVMVQDPVTIGMHPLISDVAGAIFPTEFPAYHRLDLRLSRKGKWWGLPVTTYTEIRNVYNRKNTIRFHLAGGLADRLEAELETLEFEEDTEVLTEALGFELNEYLEIQQSRFIFSIGFLYEF
ncbi:TonB-dependent receptor plug domain-containing protein [Candidatus Poribacteria bacterium]|nr:TonB-dependent receptor plug domain-containing protein [Candidatus Poribacteria bacterium]MYH82094.1 TonB-dependent receptor plug domain-containing protein [Candidatus Poribacteria bacterium]MYK96685.1 TonB-dependent receptor plug domain-containing protein [Candidatus Poribacteria bacterium]